MLRFLVLLELTPCSLEWIVETGEDGYAQTEIGIQTVEELIASSVCYAKWDGRGETIESTENVEEFGKQAHHIPY